jgi:hypothetical protein
VTGAGPREARGGGERRQSAGVPSEVLRVKRPSEEETITVGPIVEVLKQRRLMGAHIVVERYVAMLGEKGRAG